MFKIFLQKKTTKGGFGAVNSCVVVCPENKNFVLFLGAVGRLCAAKNAHTHQPEKSKEII